MFTNSLFSDFIRANGLKDYKDKSTRDIICIEFDYGSRSYEEEIKHITKLAREQRLEVKKAKSSGNKEQINKAIQKRKYLRDLYKWTNFNSNRYVKKSADDIRIKFYTEGVKIKYPKFDKDKNIIDYDIIDYKMLYRTPGKAKKGSCMFIKKSLWKKAHNFLWMGLMLPKQNAPIVEIGAYSSLITSTIENKICIKPEEILVVRDVESFFETNVISVELDKDKHCVAIPKDKYQVKNTLFDGQALIDSSIFPDWGNGYVLLRQHFTKCAAFNTNIQLFMQDKFGENYHTATVKDMWGRDIKVDKIKLITTDNALKWLKFDVSFDYWSKWVEKNGCMWGIVKTAHASKLGDAQRMSYQMVNTLTTDIMSNVLIDSKDYILQMKMNNEVFIDYLERNKNFCNDYEVLAALLRHCPEFERSDYFRTRKNAIINTYMFGLKNGELRQNADNLVFVGSPYAMLLHSIGEDVENDKTFTTEKEAIQCYTEKFKDGEYLATFRSPHNSKNNILSLHNVYSEEYKKYFNLGKQILVLNVIHTDVQDRANGCDFDSDSGFTTNQADIVECAKYCYLHYPTIVNNIPKDKNIYDSSLKSFAIVDNIASASQTDIGESSNLAQLCLSYSFSFEDSRKYLDYVCILSVLAQVAIDSCKRRFDVNITDEIHRIKKDINVKENKYPAFWLAIRKDFNKKNINKKLSCPMNNVYKMEVPSYKPKESTLPISDFFINHEYQGSKKVARKIEDLIEKYSLSLLEYHTNYTKNFMKTLYNKNSDRNDEIIVLRADFDEMMEDIRRITLPKKYIYVMSWLINRAFYMTSSIKGKRDTIDSKLDKNRSILLQTLYQLNPECLLECFKKTLS